MNSSTGGDVLLVTGTSTDVGKTIVTAALAAACSAGGKSVAVCKPAQTGVDAGEPGDLAAIAALVGEVDVTECARYPAPLAPETAATRAGLAQLELATVVDSVTELTGTHDLTLVEGAGGVMVRLGTDLTALDVADALGAAALVVTPAGLGALNHAELTVEALRARGIRPAGLVIGSSPDDPDLAMRCNRDDLPRLTGVPLVGVIPQGVGSLAAHRFRTAAPTWFDPGFLASLVARPTAETRTADQPIEGVHA